MAEPQTGKIVDWNAERGFGFLDHQGKRVFLHLRDYSTRHHLPRKGDRVSFLIGNDGKGRTCAKNVREITTRSRVGFFDLLTLMILLPLPIGAAMKLPLGSGIAIVGLFFLSLNSWAQYASDKKRAEAKGWRISEAALHFGDFIGGWPGGFLAQRYYRHKTEKRSFQFVFWAIVLLHEIVALDYLGDWALLKSLRDGL